MNNFYTSCHTHGDHVLVRGFDGTKRFMKTVKYKPYMFVRSQSKQGKYKTIKGDPCDKLAFPSIKEARGFIKQYKDVEGLKLYGITNFEYLYLYDTYHRGTDVAYDPAEIVVAGIDIEVASDDGFPSIIDASKEITAITVRVGPIKHVFGCGVFVTNNPNVKYYKCVDERVLLETFLTIWNGINPDVIIGWNIEGFDIPYLINRITNVINFTAAKRLSPWKLLREKKVMIFNREVQIWTVVGVNVLDYLQLYKKFTYNQQESYKLDHIAMIELGEKKLDYSEYGSLLNLYKQNYQKFIEYNIHDVDLIFKLDDKMKLLDLVYAMAYDARVNMADVLGTVKLWDIIIHNYLMDRRTVVEPINIPEQSMQIQGAYVKDPIVGLHKWIVSFDLTSLYPHLIMQYNISPETFVIMHSAIGTIDRLLDGLRNVPSQYSKFATSANGCLFRRDIQGFLPALMKHQFDLRTKYKKDMLEAQKATQLIEQELQKRGIDPNSI